MEKRDDAGKAGRSKDGFSASERRRISTAITIGTVLAAAAVWFPYWISTESMRMLLETARSIGIY